MKKIAVIATGGTIAGTGKAGEAAEYQAGELPVSAIIESIPQIQDLAELELHSICAVDSNDISRHHLADIQKLCHALDQREDIDGIVITHGTDTLEETSFMLNLVCDVHKPLIITGAMRPATATSADGPMNLYQAVALACEPKAGKMGVLTLFSNTIYSGRDLAKHNSVKIDAFRTSEFGTLGYMRDGSAYLLQQPYRPHTFQSELTGVDLEQLPDVEIFFVHQESDPRLLQWMLDHYKGVVIAGTGGGNYPRAIQNVIEQADDSCLIVRCSRLSEGLCYPSPVFDPEERTIPSYRISPAKARILLQLGLAAGKSKDEIRSLFETY